MLLYFAIVEPVYLYLVSRQLFYQCWHVVSILLSQVSNHLARMGHNTRKGGNAIVPAQEEAEPLVIRLYYSIGHDRLQDCG